LGTTKKGRLIPHAWLYVPSLDKTLASMDLASPFFDSDVNPVMETVFIPWYSIPLNMITTGYDVNRTRFVVVFDSETRKEMKEMETFIQDKPHTERWLIAIDKSKSFLTSLQMTSSVIVDGRGFISGIYRRQK
jgi:hypothetical protein